MQISESSHELVYVAFDVVYLGGKGAKEAFERAGLQQGNVCVGMRVY